MIESISLREMQKLHELAKYDNVGEMDYVFVHVGCKTDVNVKEELDKAFRFNGMIIALMVQGSMCATVNMEYCKLDKGSLFVLGPNSIIDVDVDTVTDDMEAYVLFVSTDFLRDLNFEIVVLNTMPLKLQRREPSIRLTDDEMEMLVKYMELLDMNARHTNPGGDSVPATNDEHLKKSISRSLLTATFYQLMSFGLKRNAAARASKADDDDETAETESARGKRPRSRRSIYMHEFIRLVRKYFRYERTVGFYADKLCISPKYLSLVVKESTHTSAARIIDEYVILEAKNLLRFSGKNVQQVAYELNFPNQSSFGKYFKHLTGMSPTEFQNS